MGRPVYSAFLALLIITASQCKTNGDYQREAEQLRSISNEYKRTGMISSSTYQVYFQVIASSDDEAMNAAQSQAEPLALRYLLKEPFIYVTIGPYGVQKLKDIIHKKGRIVAIQKAGGDFYDAVFHINDYALREQFQVIR